MMSFSFLLMMLTLGAGVTEAGKLVYAVIETEADLVCPDAEKHCSSDNTCCQSTSGQWECCPYAEASCCSDKRHCCEKGFTCDSTGLFCRRTAVNKTMTWAKKLPASVKSKQVGSRPENALCDGFPCPGSCCKSFIGYTCCPFGCCAGGTGCCFSGYGRRAAYPRSEDNIEWSLIEEEGN